MELKNAGTDDLTNWGYDELEWSGEMGSIISLGHVFRSKTKMYVFIYIEK